MSAIHRLSRSKSRSPKHSPASSPKRKPLHERTNSDTNSLAGSASTGPPPIKDDSDPVYSSSPFPRLPSQVLSPRGAPLIFEDNTATAGSKENVVAGPSSSGRSKVSKPRSPTGKGKGRRSPRSSPKSSLDAARSRPGSVASRYGRGGSRDLTRPLDELRRPPRRSNSRVQSMVSAIEASSIKSQSPPPTPRTPRTRSRGSRASFTSRRYEIGSRGAESIAEEKVPSLGQPFEPSSFSDSYHASMASRPAQGTEDSSGGQVESSEQSSQEQQSSEQRTASEEPAQSVRSDRQELRPRSSSAPLAPTEMFLAALIANDAIQYPTLERPSAASIRTDTSSFRQSAPRPLQLRRQPARSNLAADESSTDVVHSRYRTNYPTDSRVSVAESYNAPGTPPAQIRVHPPSSGRWTPGRWDSEMEDDVPEMRPNALRAQRSYRDSWAESLSDLRRSESVTSFQSQSSAAHPFYQFLNDSKTAWARAYYRGEGALRIATPPNVTMIRSLSARSATRTPNSSHSRSTSDPTDTPDSATYAQEVFVPRIRPFRNPGRAPQRRLPPAPTQSNESFAEAYYDRPLRPTHERADHHLQPSYPSPNNRASWVSSIEDQEDQPELGRSEEYETPSHERPLPSIPPPEPFIPHGTDPHLTPDRGNDDRISVWRPPSIERQSLFGTVNRQIFLFCLGFCFPFGMCNYV